MREPQNISQLLELKPDFMGMIFYHKSPRFVDFNLCPSETLVQKIPSVKKVGVFVNQPVDEILSIVAKFNLDVVQLHGSETPDKCGIFKQKGISVFKAFGISTKEIWKNSNLTKTLLRSLYSTPKQKVTAVPAKNSIGQFSTVFQFQSRFF